MSQPKKREVVFQCVVCEEPSYQLETEVDFGPRYGKRKIRVCGQCLRLAEREKIFDFVALDMIPLLPFVPGTIVEEVMGKVLDEFRELPQQGS